MAFSNKKPFPPKPRNADSDLGSPSDFGPPPPPRGGQAPAPDNDADDQASQAPAVVSPEAVNYHDDLHTCETCTYMGGDGNCAILQMQVQPQGGCNAFESSEGGGAPTGQA